MAEREQWGKSGSAEEAAASALLDAEDINRTRPSLKQRIKDKPRAVHMGPITEVSKTKRRWEEWQSEMR